MKYVSPTKWWSIELPDRWKAEKAHGYEGFSAAPEIGLLQFDGSRDAKGDVTDEQLLHMARKHIDAGATPATAQCGDFTGFSLSLSDTECDTQLYLLRCGRIMVIAIYTRTPDAGDAERPVIDSILATLRAEPESQHEAAHEANTGGPLAKIGAWFNR